MWNWLKRKLRPPIPLYEPYVGDPSAENLYKLLKHQCPVCGKKPPDWFEGDDPDDDICGRCAAIYVVDRVAKTAKKK